MDQYISDKGREGRAAKKFCRFGADLKELKIRWGKGFYFWFFLMYGVGRYGSKMGLHRVDNIEKSEWLNRGR